MNSVYGLAGNSARTSAVEVRESHVGSEMSRIGNLLDSGDVEAGALEERLQSVLNNGGPENPNKNPALVSPAKVPLADRLNVMAGRLESLISRIAHIRERIEL